jgi:uncharacterized membrane protein
MSDMSTIPFFGTSFTVYAPLLILAVCVFTLFDVYPKLLHTLGIEHEDALLCEDEDTLNNRVNEGIQLMKRESERSDTGPVRKMNLPDNRGLALVPSREMDDDYNMNMDGCCRGRYSDGSNVLV